VAANSHLSPELGYGRGFDRYLCVGLGDADSVNAVFRKWRTSILEGKDPVFVWRHYYDPHHPYEQNQPWFSEFVPGVTSADATLMRSAGGSPPMKPREEMRRKRFAELARGLYDSEIRRTDESIASLFKDLPFLNDYLVIVTGDHGEEFLDHGNVTHCQNLYEETLRVPLLWKWPGGGAAAGRTDALTSLVDIPSTLLTLAGGTPPATWSGISLFAAGARLPSVPPERAIVADLDRNPATGRMECLVTDQYKLIRQPNWKRIELYDLKMDPGERNDLSKTDKETAARLEAELKRFFGRLPAAPLRVARRPLSKEAEVELKGQGYIH
jgi:arylsulfatase A-like enzyme